MPEATVNAVVTAARVVRASARVALADLRTIYTPVTWTVGWLGRIIMQVIFFALIGRLLGSHDALVFLFVGQCVMATVLECCMAVQSTTWERRTGTLALLMAKPAPLWPVFVGRSLQWLPSGVATGSIVLLGIGPVFGVRFGWEAASLAVLAIAVSAVTMYPVALTVAAIVLRVPRWRNVASNVTVMSLTLLCGVTVPVTIWPESVQIAIRGLPLTHTLAAVRDLQASGVSPPIARPLIAALVLGVAWYAVACCAFTVFGAAGRRDGSIDFSD